MAWGRPGLLRDLFGIDVRSLAVFRVSLGLVLCWDLFDRMLGIEAHYTQDGLVPAKLLQALSVRPVYSLHLLSDTLNFQVLLFAVASAAALMLLLGWRTRVATLVSFVLILSMHSRNPLTLHHGDTLLRVLLMWGMFLPLGARASVDARRGLAAAVASPVLSIASAALMLQGFFVYLIATISKLQYDSWWDGRALYAVVHKSSYVRPLGEYLAQFPEVLELFSHATLFVEGAIPVLFFSPWKRDRCRVFAVLLGLGLHAGIFAVVDVGTFQPVTTLALFPWLPASLWNKLGWRLGDADAKPWRPRWGAQAVAGLFLGYTVISNALAIDVAQRNMPEPLATLGYVLRLDQRWRMFANTDATQQGWWVVAGKLKNGAPFDLLHGTTKVSFERPEHYYREMPNMAWRTYWANISNEHYAPFRPSMGRYFCSSWNRNAASELRTSAVQVIYVAEHNYKAELGGIVRPRELVTTDCAEPPPR